MITPLTEYAGFWRRVIATLVDTLWLSILLLPLLHLVYGGDYLLMPDSLVEEPFEWQGILINDLLPALLIIGFWVRFSATPGKWLLDCEIVNAKNGEPLTPRQALLRYIGYFVATLPFGLGILWIIWDKHKQGWHDKIAGTVVIIHDEATIPLPELDKNYR